VLVLALCQVTLLSVVEDVDSLITLETETVHHRLRLEFGNNFITRMCILLAVVAVSDEIILNSSWSAVVHMSVIVVGNASGCDILRRLKQLSRKWLARVSDTETNF